MKRNAPPRRSLVILTLSGAVWSASCAPAADAVSARLEGSASITVADTRGADITGAWRLVSLDDRPQPDGGGPILVDITSGQIAARRSCRPIAWSYALVDAALTTTRLPGPDASCPDPVTPWEEAASRFIDDASVAALRDDGALVLAMESRLAVFERTP